MLRDCGCEQRKDVMFVRGGAGLDCLCVILVPVAAFALYKLWGAFV